MRDIFYCIPTAKSPDDPSSTIPLWRERGYRVAAYRDTGMREVSADLNIFGEYKGYAHAVNQLSRIILETYPAVNWIITGGDDVKPDPNMDPLTIAQQCEEHFGGTYGVMQPTGDEYMVQNGLRATERVCESPWMGRGWCERINGGRGPLHETYRHFFVDQELHEVAKMLGVLWHRRDLIHYHENWNRLKKSRPSYLTEAKLGWQDGSELFSERKRYRFPGHEPLRIAAADVQRDGLVMEFMS